MVKKISHQPFF